MKTISLFLFSASLFLLSVSLVPAQTFNFLVSGSQATTNNTPTGSAGWVSASLSGNTLGYSAYFEGFSALNAAHFHGPAFSGETAGVIAGIASGGEGSPISGFVSLSDDEIAELLTGQHYLNFHTPENPGGEIRGQVVGQLDFMPTTLLSGAQEVPVVNSLGAGAARVVFNSETGELSWKVLYEGLDSGVTGMHFHGAAEVGSNAGVKVNIGSISGLESGTSGTTILADAQDIADLTAGLWYLNIHTAAHPGGEIRGQVMPLVVSGGAIVDAEYNFLLSGSQALTNSVPTGSAGWVSASLSGDTLSYTVYFEGLSSLNAAHFHGPAISLTNAGVIAGISSGGDSSPIMGSVVLTEAQVAELKAGQYYLNLHTPENGGGEIRGQVIPQLDFTPSTLLSGAQEVPVVSSLGAGAARVEFDAASGELSWTVVYEGLESGVTGMHFHGPAAVGANAGVKVNVGNISGLASGTSGSAILTDAQDIADLMDGLWYLNIHTADNPSGEIRGQVLPVVVKTPLPWEDVAVGESGFSSWFGAFEVGSDEWVRNVEQGWLYVGFVEEADSMWLYSLTRESWIWSSESIYPTAYDSATAQWIIFIVLPSGSVVYDYNTGQWTSVP